MSEYYIPPTPIPPATLARSADVNAVSEASEAGFDNLPSDLSGLKSEVENGRDGESSLLAKNQSQDDKISELSSFASTGYPDQTGKTGFLRTDGELPYWYEDTFHKMPHDIDLAIYTPLDDSYNQTVRDYSGYGNNGSSGGSISFPSIVRGVSGNARSFDGLTNVINFGDGVGTPLADIGDNSFWISIWMTGGNNDSHVVRKGIVGKEIIIFVHDDNVNFYLNNGVDDPVTVSSTSKPLLSSNPQHIAAAYNSVENSIKIYVNAVVESSMFISSSNFGNSGNLSIGGDYDGSGVLYSGVLDEFRVYNGIATQENVEALFLNPGGMKNLETTTLDIIDVSGKLEVVENNLVLETFRRMIGDSQSGAEAFQDGWRDTFGDESNVDLPLCVNQRYFPVGDYYSGVTRAIVKEYSESNQDGTIIMYSGINEQAGVAFTLASGANVGMVQFYVIRAGSPSGNVTAKLYNATGTVGTDAIPTGSALAASTPIDISELPTSFTMVDFVLEVPQALSAGDYCILLEFSGGDASNSLSIGTDVSAPPHSAGNTFRTPTAGSGWTAYLAADICFKLFSESYDGDMALVFDSYLTDTEPIKSKTLFIMEPVDTVTINTDIKAFASNDNGSTYEQITLSDEGDWETGQKIIVGTEDMTSTGDTTTRLKITTHNSKELKIRAASHLLMEV